MANDKLVIFGKAIPNDSLIVELFNPTGNLIFRTQLDVSPTGDFAAIILVWPEPDENKFRVGTYTLTVTSSMSRDLSISKAFNYQVPQIEESKDLDIINRLDLDLAIPSLANINQSIPIIAYATLNDMPLIGLEEINATIIYPDGSNVTIDNFRAIEDGVYETRFTSNSKGYHSIILHAKHQDLMITKPSIINIIDGKESTSMDALKQDLDMAIDYLDRRLSNNTSNISTEISKMKDSITSMESSIGQLTSLLLPIIGMIVIIVALQATILAKRK